MNTYVLSFHEIDQAKFMLAGGKGANLGELSRINEIRVPEGFCVTTKAYRQITESNQELNRLLDEITRLKPKEREQISSISAKIRALIESTPLPNGIADEIICQLAKLGENDAFAVRSSATAEDLPGASFAGQQDTYLNIIGREAILKHISKCWASLFTERAVIYRLRNGFDHRKVLLAVVVQKMLFPHAAGILFTADPVTGNRKISSIDAGFGLGEAMVSGLVNPDIYKVCNDKVIDKKISTKQLAIYAADGGGTETRPIDPSHQKSPALTEQQILQLARTGRQIEAHFGRPQDIEWCLVDNTFFIVQSRPITTLYPIPEANDQENHVYVSVGHQQMMTDPIRPLGLSFFLMTTSAPMYKAGGRLFVDIMNHLASSATRDKMINLLGQSDPLIKDALLTVVKRGDFIPSSPDDKAVPANSNKVLSWSYPEQFENNPAIVADLISSNQATIEALRQNIQPRSGTDLFDFIREDIRQSKTSPFIPRSLDVIMVAMHASSWLNEKMMEWLGEGTPRTPFLNPYQTILLPKWVSRYWMSRM